MSVNERLARLEAKFEDSGRMVQETRDEMRQFRRDLFNLITPLVSQVAVLEEKSRRWGPVYKVGSATALAAVIAEVASLFRGGTH